MKLEKVETRIQRAGVAPLVGAWIEMIGMIDYKSLFGVAPLVGAWIEILRTAISVSFSASLLSWERGLKIIVSTTAI